MSKITHPLPISPWSYITSSLGCCSKKHDVSCIFSFFLSLNPPIPLMNLFVANSNRSLYSPLHLISDTRHSWLSYPMTYLAFLLPLWTAFLHFLRFLLKKYCLQCPFSFHSIHHWCCCSWNYQVSHYTQSHPTQSKNKSDYEVDHCKSIFLPIRII